MLSRTFLILAAVMLFATFSYSADTSSLKPPPGAKVAIVEFIDLQCPDCAAANPLLKEAAKTYNIPIVRHDFPLPKHNWSFDAAVIAKYFDGQSKALGNAWRDYCFENQPAVTPENLRSYAEKFAGANHTMLPFVVDPDGKLASEVKADFALGQRVGIEHTPTIYVVSNKTLGRPFVEVVDRSKLYSIIDDMMAQSSSSNPKAKATRVAKK
ncbi:MAG: thioredoxin domain-containing protein [Acidobacteria bacterium]|nr:thioredoxin domain-containing protein [Acidobacteriota bacterium]MBV9435547.1 thioredoxin domain-containing protein [Acidobacteriota bacterium]